MKFILLTFLFLVVFSYGQAINLDFFSNSDSVEVTINDTIVFKLTNHERKRVYLTKGKHIVHYKSDSLNFSYKYNFQKNTNLRIENRLISSITFYKAINSKYGKLEKIDSYEYVINNQKRKKIQFTEIRDDGSILRRSSFSIKLTSLELQLKLIAKNSYPVIRTLKLQPFMTEKIVPNFILTNETIKKYEDNRKNIVSYTNYAFIASEIYFIANHFSLKNKADKHYANYLTATNNSVISNEYSSYISNKEKLRINLLPIIVNGLILVYLNFFESWSDLSDFYNKERISLSYINTDERHLLNFTVVF